MVHSLNYIDDKYEFSAPKYFDFSAEETAEEAARAERWFETPKDYLPSPFVAKTRSLLESKSISCIDGTYNEVQKLIARVSCEPQEVSISGSSETSAGNNASADIKVNSKSRESIDTAIMDPSNSLEISKVSEHTSGNDTPEDASESKTESLITACLPSSEKKKLSFGLVKGSSSGKIDKSASVSQEKGELSVSKIGHKSSLSCSLVVGNLLEGKSSGDHIIKDITVSASSVCQGVHNCNAEDLCTPECQYGTEKEKSGASFQIEVAAGNLLAKNNEIRARRRAQMKKLKRPLARSQRPKPEIPSASQIRWENHYGNKRQKLEGGQSRQVCDLRAHIPIVKAPTLTVPKEFHFHTEERFQTHRGMHCQAFAQGGSAVSPYVPLAERVLRFQFNATERFRNRPENQPLTLTRPKEPELVTSHRARPPRVKSSVELEEEMLVNMPKFKARPLNKKILEAPTLPALPRSKPQLPDFQEFNLQTAERALLHLSTSYKSASGSEIQFVSASDRCSSMLNNAFTARPGHYVPTTSIKRRTMERIEEKEPVKKFKVLEYSSDTKKSMPYLMHEEASHLPRSAQENSNLLLSSAKNVLSVLTTQNNTKQLQQNTEESVDDSVRMQISQNAILKENMLHPSQFISGSAQELGTLTKEPFEFESQTLISRESAHVSENKRKPLSEICMLDAIQFGLKTNNSGLRACTWKGKTLHDQSSPASVQNCSVPGHSKEPLSTPIEKKNAVFTRQDSQTVTSLSVSRHMR